MPDLPSYPGVPRWAVVFGTIVIIALALLFVIRQLTLGGAAGHMH